MSIDVKRLYEDIERSPDLIPAEYDGSYELMDSIIREYRQLPSLSDVTFLDLNAIYGMAIGTWALSIEKKKDYVNKTCLSSDSKMKLYAVLDNVWDRACRDEYEHNTKKYIEENINPDFTYDYPIVGMFGTGFYTFNTTTAEQTKRFIQMCISIQDMDDDESIYQTVEQAMQDGVTGMQAASLSVILHCLKPYTFPILNGNYKGETIYPILGVELDNIKSSKTYAENCRRIKKYRDSNFGRISYRVFDVFSLHLDEYENQDVNEVPLDIDLLTDEQDDEDSWWPSQDEYPVNISAEEWKAYIEKVEMPSHPFVMKMLKGMLELGGTASCKQLSEAYGGNPSSYIGKTVGLGRRVKKYFNLPPCIDIDVERYFPFPFQGHSAPVDGVNQYIYRMRPELKEALNMIDLGDIDPHAPDESKTNKHTRYWLYSPGKEASEWNTCKEQGVIVIGWPELEDLNQYETLDQIKAAMKGIYGDKSSFMMDALATWEFSRVIKKGDIIFAKKGRSKILGRGVVISDYYYDGERGDYPNVIGVNWTHIGERETTNLLQEKTLTEIYENKAIGKELLSLYKGESESIEKYTDTDFLNEVYISAQKLQEMKDLLAAKKNIILQGAPGVGKTFSAERLAYAKMSEKDNSRIQFIQFHQNYSYEDFIMGFKPTNDGGFKLEPGVFYNFCEMARKDSNHDYFFIIDEINRGNMSKIFGELLMAIEADYREHDVRLAYKDEDFSVPKNLYLIGMMNTADRSLAMIDYALRRRFSFISMEPGFNTDGFRAYQKALNSEIFNKLIDAVKALNGKIRTDESLGKGFCIGHSYFCGMKPQECTVSRLQQIVKYDLIPTLEEYWFDNKNVLDAEVKALKEAVNLTDE